MNENLDLLEKIFQNIEMTLSFKEAKEKAFLFWHCVAYEKIMLEDDYWIQISKEWDLNISDGDIVLYPVCREGKYFSTDTSRPCFLVQNYG